MNAVQNTNNNNDKKKNVKFFLTNAGLAIHTDHFNNF